MTFFQKIPIFGHPCATLSELPSNLSTMEPYMQKIGFPEDSTKEPNYVPALTSWYCVRTVQIMVPTLDGCSEHAS